MQFLLSHLWLPWLISIILMLAAFAVLRIRDTFQVLCIAAVVEAIPVTGLWCTGNGHLLFGGMIAALCLLPEAAAVLCFRKAVRAGNAPFKGCGIAAGILAVLCAVYCIVTYSGDMLQTVLMFGCLTGLLSIAYVLAWLGAFADGMCSTS